MTTTVQVTFQDGTTGYITINDVAEEAVRFKFNPSGLHNVNVLKALAAAFISKCHEVQGLNPEAGRELAVAITNMQTASMWSVLGATKGL